MDSASWLQNHCIWGTYSYSKYNQAAKKWISVSNSAWTNMTAFNHCKLKPGAPVPKYLPVVESNGNCQQVTDSSVHMSSHVKPDIQRCPQYSTSSVCFIIHASGWTWPTFKAFHDTQHVLACVANTINTCGKLATWNHWLLHLSTILFQSVLRCSKENSCPGVSLNPPRVCLVRFSLILIGANTYY